MEMDILYNKSGEVRHLWRLLITLVLIFVSMFIIELFTALTKVDRNLFSSFFIGLITGTLLSLKFIYKAPFDKLGLTLNKKNLVLIFVGILIPIADQLPRYVIDKVIFNYSAGWNHTELNKSLLTSLFVFIFVAAGEELFFRVYLIGYLGEKLNLVYLFLFSVVLFAIGHSIGNPSYNYISFLAYILHGIFWSLLYLLSRSFYLVMSAHAIHNTLLLYYSNQNTYMMSQLLELVIVFIIAYSFYRKKKLLATAEAV